MRRPSALRRVDELVMRRKTTHDEVYRVPLSAPRAEIETMMAKRRPPTGPARARPKSRPARRGERQLCALLCAVRHTDR